MNYDLPTMLEVGGEAYDIRYDYRCILDIFSALEDPELESQDKAYVAVSIFYPDFDDIPAECYQEAVERCFWFINGGEVDAGKKGKRLVSWEQDFRYIIAPVSRVLGTDVRSIPYDREKNTGGLHWWTFLSAYMEIGDCVFAQIVRIRNLKASGKKLDKSDQEWYRQNRHLVDFKQTFTEVEEEVLSGWGAK